MAYKSFDNGTICSLRDWIGAARGIVLLSHMNADGDAVGSMMGLATLIEQGDAAHATVTPILPNGCPKTFGWMPHSQQILNGETQQELCEQRIAEADLIICVDFNQASRIDFLEGALLQARGRKVLIDHHHSPALEQFDLVVSDPSISSASELTYWLARSLWGESRMSQDAATCLFTGLNTDTGGFAFSNEQPSLYEAAADLVRYDIHPAEIHNRIVNTFSTNKMQFFGFAIAERLRIYPQLHRAYFYISLDDQKRFGVGPEDMDGLVNYTLQMADIEAGALIREEPKRCKISFRSKYTTDVNQLAQQIGGGGHTRAAGATSLKGFSETIRDVERLLGIN